MLLLCTLLWAPRPVSSRVVQDWNGAAIAWEAYAAGMERAKRENKFVCLVIYTTWCPHCTKYSRVFHDPRVVAAARNFVMIKADRDTNPDLSKKYSLDGEYIPRTYFVSPDGTVARVDAGRDEYRYFYDEDDPTHLLSAMKRVLASRPTGPAAAER
jgi:thiol-disulfide isomerase/thioredoxin